MGAISDKSADLLDFHSDSMQSAAAITASEKENKSSLGKNDPIPIRRFFTARGVSPYDEIKWEKRSAVITNDKGEIIFRQEGVKFPDFWSQTAINIVASKYFWGALGSKERENSARQLIGRVVDTFVEWGLKDGYFNAETAEIFGDELAHILLNQKASFNSPVWFNMGIEKKPQCSACFINSVEDTLESIMDLAKIEGMLFKYGSGTGTNLSILRSSRERLSGGGTASGPVSFMRGYDAFAGVIKSGGKTRRAAKMVILNIDHPDIVEFINSKKVEEEKAKSLIRLGYDSSLGGDAYSSVFFQNGNHSVRVPDAFMRAFEEDREWYTKKVKGGEMVDLFRAKDMMKMIAEATHTCGDPGLQFDSTINKWHTCKNSGKINASNPCSEYMFLDDSACNLASINLLRFLNPAGEFDVEAFRHTIDIIITAQELIVSNASYPREKIDKNSNLYRPLGLGYANLGALLMALGLPYDSEAGRALAATITAVMTGQAYSASAKIAEKVGTFAEYERNREPMLNVIRMHRDALKNVDSTLVPEAVYQAAAEAWNEALERGGKYGFRNAQVSVLAPTGTIGFMMDCDTTGIEPELALVKYKTLVGGGKIKLVNKTVARALKMLGYAEDQMKGILEYTEKNGTIEGAPLIHDDHLPVFDCAFKPAGGMRYIHYMGHIKMMAAAQPFLSGAISKTVNVPEEISPEEIMEIYYQSWKMGLKAIAIYRDNSKGQQILTTNEKETGRKDSMSGEPTRLKLPLERKAITHKFSIAGHEGYLTVGMYESGMPGEIFIVMAKEGSTISGLMDAFATSVSLALQYGVPLDVLIKKFSYTRFEPSGFTGNREIGYATSIMDYIFRWLANKFLERMPQEQTVSITSEQMEPKITEVSVDDNTVQTDLFKNQEDAPPCHGCGAIMIRSGSCYKCLNCGETSGCS
jgi:ribonucleoside-diphosphate reductase alpha chain